MLDNILRVELRRHLLGCQPSALPPCGVGVGGGDDTLLAPRYATFLPDGGAFG